MLEFASAFKGYALEANDGEIGAIADFLFDGRTLAVRWLVVMCGEWLKARKIFLHPSAIDKADNERCELSVNLTKAQLRILLELSKQEQAQMERRLDDDDGCWTKQIESATGDHPIASPTPQLFVLAPPSETATHRIDDPHLHSVDDAVTGYRVVGVDGAIGKVEDLLIDEVNWSLPYVVVDTDHWWSGNHVLISRHAMKEISCAERQIRADLNRQQIKASLPWTALSDVADVGAMAGAGNRSLVYVIDATATTTGQ